MIKVKLKEALQGDELKGFSDALRDIIDAYNSSKQPNRKNSNNGNQGGKSKKKKPLIFGNYNKEYQDAEDKARNKADEYVDDEGNTKDGKENIFKKYYGERNSEAGDASFDDEASDVKASSDFSARRRDAITKAFDSINDDEFHKEIVSRAEAEKRLKDIQNAQKEAEKYERSDIHRFEYSINKFIKNATTAGRGKTWSRFDKNSVSQGLIRQGSKRLENKNIPSIFVYFDQSGSWTENKIAIGKKAISVLNKYVQRHQLIIKLWYFDTQIKDHPFSGGGTGGQCIVNHINEFKPDNVIIMTDSDISDINKDCQLPGGVWLLFCQGQSINLKEKVTGKLTTEWYDITDAYTEEGDY